MFTCESFDSKFFELFKSANSNNNKSACLQNALQRSSDWVLTSATDEKKITKELFSSRRSADWKQLDNISQQQQQQQQNIQPIRVVGFVQELDTEASLIEVEPEHFVRSIVCCGENYSNNENQQREQQQHQPLFAECLNAFITPIPGFLYAENDDGQCETKSINNNKNNNNNNNNSNTLQNTTSRQANSIQKRDRLQEQEGPTTSSQLNNGQNTKKARTEEEVETADEKTPNCSKSNNVTALAYGDEEHIRKNANIADRKLWRDVLGLSLAPTHQSLATGVIGLFPHLSSPFSSSSSCHDGNSSSSSPQLFELVELIGFLIPPSTATADCDVCNESGLERQNQNQMDLEEEMTSKFHRIPDSVAPRLLVVGWRRIPSIENAHELVSSSLRSPEKQQQQQQQQSDDEHNFHQLKNLLKLRVFGNEKTERNADASAFMLLLHLISSVTIRNESGAFGDLTIALEVLFSDPNKEDGNNSNNNNNRKKQQRKEFENFVSKLSEAVRALRPCSMTCNLDYKVGGAVDISNRRENGDHTQNNLARTHHLNLTHASSLIARLDYEQQAVSSCLFSLPKGAEMIFAIDDVENEMKMEELNVNDNRNSSNARNILKSFANYSRNMTAFSELIISQKLPLLFGPQCEISFERDLGLLLVIRKNNIEDDNNNNRTASKKEKEVSVDADSSTTTTTTSSSDNKPAAFGRDIFLPLRCKVDLVIANSDEDHEGQNNNNNQNGSNNNTGSSPSSSFSEFSSYFRNVRELYQESANPSNNNNKNFSSRSYFEESDGDEYFLKILNQDLKNNSRVWWSTAMIKHSAANVLLTMARARACLGGRRLVRKSDLDEVSNLLIHIKTNKA